MPDGDVLIRAVSVSKKFCRDLKRSLWYGICDTASDVVGRGTGSSSLRPAEFWAIHDFSMELRRGECLGLVGRNGAGKTTLLKMLNGLIKPDQGRIELRGRIGALIALGAGFNPILTGRENIYVNGSILGLTKREIDQTIDDIIGFAEVGEFIDAPVQSYSSGMQVRLGFAVATALKPDILLLDEVLAVGDAAFRYKCFERIGSILSNSAVVFVSHDSYSLQRICNKGIWLKNGKVEISGDIQLVLDKYLSATHEFRDQAVITSSYISNVTANANIISEHPIDDTSAIDLEVIVTFYSEIDVEVFLAVGNIIRTDDQCAGQFVFTEHINNIHLGFNEIGFVLTNLQLACGNYQLTAAVFVNSGQELAIGIRYFGLFRVEDNRRYGPQYAISTRKRKQDAVFKVTSGRPQVASNEIVK
jgi:lipopolysaccharide transport system ATP-binding protein